MAKSLSFSSYAKEVNKNISDPMLKELLFGMDEVEGSDIKGIGVLYKMMTFTFMFAYAKYKYDRDNKKLRTDSPNAKRVVDAFECIYNGEDVGLDLIVYVLTEIQLDVISMGDRSYFKGVFGNNSKLQIPVLRNVIGTWLQSIKRAEQRDDVLLEYFIGLFENLEILKNVKLIEDERGYISYEYEPYGVVIPSYSLVKKDDGDSFFYLVSYGVGSNHLCRLTYYIFAGTEILNVDTSVRDFLSNAGIKNHTSAPKSILAKSLSSLSFKYIKNLALAVSDTVTRETRRKLYEHYSMRYSDIFELGYKKNLSEINWDNVFTILMIEEGPSELLEFLLDSDGFYFDKILRNLEVRYNSPGFAHEVKENYEEAQDNELGMVKKYATDNMAFVKNLDSINKTFMAKSIIDGLAVLESNEKRNDAHFVESLPMRIKTLDKIIAASDSAMSKALKINKVLEKTFRYIIPFYEGIIGYQLAKEELKSKLESKGLDPEIIDKKHQREICENAFFESASKSKEEIARLPLGRLVEAFRELTKSLISSSGGRTSISEKGKALKAAIGRNYVCSYETFEGIIKFTKEDTADIVIDHIPEDITNFINNEKHDKPETLVANVVLFNKFLLKTKELLYYFIYNEDYQREMILGQQISYDPIYPYVVRYTVKSENRDGYNINNFSVFVTDDNITNEIKILSEWDYDINEKYYCIPNIETSNKRWWIEPFLISCKRYDELIYSDGKKSKKSNEEL
jgi:hypothetical protein